MNPRYLAYCRAYQRTPGEMMNYDTDRFPGGKMCGFILWLGEQWMLFEKQHVHEERRWRMNDLDRAGWRALNADAFDIWLNEEYP